MLDDFAVCKYCHNELNVFEYPERSHSLGQVWNFECCNDQREFRFIPPRQMTPKNGRFFQINRAFVLVLRSVEFRCFESNKYNEFEQANKSKQLEGTCKNFIIKLLTSYGKKWKKEAAAAKSYTQAQNQLTTQMPDKPDSPVEIAASFDGSWNARRWSAKDGIVDACFEETGKIIDVLIKISHCLQCKRMKAKQLSCEIEYVDYLNWYVQHELECPMNHDGSAQVLTRFSLFS